MNGKILEWKIPVSSCQPSRVKLLKRFQSEKSGSDLAPEVIGLIPRLSARIKPRGGFAVFPAACSKQSVMITLSDSAVVFDCGELIASAFASATHCAVFAATIGADVEKESERFTRDGKILDGYFADVYGSESAELTAEFIHQQAQEHAKAGAMNAGNRYSPGYCGWDVSDQKKLFSLLPDNFCGIELTGSSMMMPQKSVSGIIPVGKEVKFLPYSCAVCGRKSCLYR